MCMSLSMRLFGSICLSLEGHLGAIWKASGGSKVRWFGCSRVRGFEASGVRWFGGSGVMKTNLDGQDFDGTIQRPKIQRPKIQ